MKGLQIQSCEQEKREPALYILFAVPVLTGLIRIFLSGFDGPGSYWWIYAAAAAGIVILPVLIPEKFEEYIVPAGCGILVILFLAGYRISKSGFYALLNEAAEFLTGKTGKIYLDYPVNSEKDIYFAAVVLSGLLVLAVYRIAEKRSILLLLFLLFTAAVFTACGFGRMDFGWLFLLAGVVAFRFQCGFRRSSAGLRLRTVLVYSGELAGCLILAAALCAGRADIDTGYQLRQIKYAVHRLLYDRGNDAMPEGNLSNPGTFVKEGENSLTVTMEKPQKLYLRGMTGEVYTGTSWEALEEEANQEGEALFYWLHKEHFYGLTGIARTSVLSGNEKTYRLTIETENACRKHQYLPYALAGDDTLDPMNIGDGEEAADSLQQTVSYTAGSVPEWYEAVTWVAQHQSDEKVQEYLKQEQSYREFVYEYDLQLTNSALGVMTRLFGQDQKERSLSEILNLVRSTLEERLSYNEKVQTLNGKNDFLQYVIEQSRQGYSVHYATAAVLMLRYFGVPARYVEGYYISSQEAAGYESGESIRLGEQHAHAWAEYYLDGVGWIPFEVTPGYIDEEEVTAAQAAAAGADGSKEEDSNLYQQNQSRYTPPKSPREDTQKPDIRSIFRFRAGVVLTVGIIFLIILILILLCLILKKRSRLKHFKKQVEDCDARTAIIELYAYCRMLMLRMKLTEPVSAEEAEKVRNIHEEARFSRHDMTEEQRSAVVHYAEAVRESCRKQNRGLRNIRYHYILWLYD